MLHQIDTFDQQGFRCIQTSSFLVPYREHGTLAQCICAMVENSTGLADTLVQPPFKSHEKEE